jgi:murein L,D-transpeptidase YcbB/YkuD
MDPEVEARLLARLGPKDAGAPLEIGGEVLGAGEGVAAFYRARGGRAAWIVDGRPSTCALELLEAVRAAGTDGLEPRAYHATLLGARLPAPGRREVVPGRLVELELLFADAFLSLAGDLTRGRVPGGGAGPRSDVPGESGDAVDVLQGALHRGEIRATLASLRPRQGDYEALREALAELVRVHESGGWDRLRDGPTLRPGEVDSRIPALRTRLRVGGDLAPGQDRGGPQMDPALAAAVARFQERHGLVVDSAVGPETRAAMNVPAEERLAQLRVNLERRRWRSAVAERRSIRINVPAFVVELVEDGMVTLRRRAVVGTCVRQTPTFSAVLTHLVLAPFWHVPPRIAALDKLPVLRRDPDHLARQKMVLLDRVTGRAVDPATVDFASLTGTDFNRRYRLRQDPGPLNALGQVKFIFPNPHAVYLHDTPERHLFRRAERTFSSGCVRVERPLDFATVLLQGDPAWPAERIREVAAGGEETTVVLADPVPVHLVYWTAFVDGDRRVHFRPDVYRRDTGILAALRENGPGR